MVSHGYTTLSDEIESSCAKEPLCSYMIKGCWDYKPNIQRTPAASTKEGEATDVCQRNGREMGLRGQREIDPRSGGW